MGKELVAIWRTNYRTTPTIRPTSPETAPVAVATAVIWEMYTDGIDLRMD